MKAYILPKFGPPSVLHLRDVSEPSPRDDEVLIAVRSIGLNFSDVFARMGVYPGIPDPPFIPGIEFSGIVHSVGRKVRGFKRNDRVMGFSRQGAYAQFVCVPEDQAVKIPRRMTFDDAAAFPVAFLSAYHGLVTLSHAARGETLLLHAAAGGVGLAAIQVAKYLGLKVFATVGSNEKLAIATREGADEVINYRAEDFSVRIRRELGPRGIDVVMDSVGGSLFRKGWEMLAPMGRYVLYGFASVAGKGGLNRFKAFREAIRVPLLYPPSVVSRNKSLMGFNLYFLTEKKEYLSRAVRQLLQWYDRRIITPRIGSMYSFDEMIKAHEFLQARKSTGKVIVRVS